MGRVIISSGKGGGYVKIGYISGKTLVTSAGGNRITPRK